MKHKRRRPLGARHLPARLGLALLTLALLLTLGWLSPPSDRAGAHDWQALADALSNSAAEGCAPEAPADALPVTLPLDSEAQWAGLVGLRVCFTHELIVVDVYPQLRRGQLGVGFQRPYAGAAAARETSELELIDPNLADPAIRIRNGDALQGVHGIFDAPRQLRAEGWRLESRNPASPAPPEVGEAALRFASFNLGNLFLTPAVRRAELPLNAQLAKISATLVALDADAVALAEVENDAGETLALLLAELNAEQRRHGRGAAAEYAAVESGVLGSDAVRVAILYRPAQLRLLRWAADAAPVHLRPPLAAHFEALSGGPDVTLVAVHHRSKSSCPTRGDLDQGFGCWNLQREAQSQALLHFTAALSAEGYPAALILGDLNAYRHEPPMERFAEAGWLLAVDAIPPERAYSYVYFGLAGALDHALLSPELAERLVGASFWSVNADEALGAGSSDATPVRASDHDPLLLGLR